MLSSSVSIAHFLVSQPVVHKRSMTHLNCVLIFPWSFNKINAVSRTLCSLSAKASRVVATNAETASYGFEIPFLK